MHMRLFFLLISILILAASTNADAAFVKRYAAATTCDTPAVTGTIHRDMFARQHMHPPRDVRGAATGAVITSLLGVGAAIAFFAVLPVSLPGAIGLGLLTVLLGAATILLVDIDDQGKKPHVVPKVIALILGMLEVMPVVLPASIVFLIYDLFRVKKKRKPRLFRHK